MQGREEKTEKGYGMDKRQYRMAADWAASAYEAWRDLGALGTFRDWVSDGVGVPAPPNPYDYYTADGTQVGYATDPEILAGEYGCDLPTLERAIAEVQPGVPPELRLDASDLTDEWMEKFNDYLVSGAATSSTTPATRRRTPSASPAWGTPWSESSPRTGTPARHQPDRGSRPRGVTPVPGKG